MSTATQRGLLLLPVALTLALVGTLAYSLTREGSMSVSEVDAKYDIEAARYLASAGVALVRWQNEKLGCTSTRKFADLPLAGGTITADQVSLDGRDWKISVTAKTARSTRSVVDYRATRYSRANASDTAPIVPSGDSDTTIKDRPGNMVNVPTLETTQDTAYALIKFENLPSELSDALIVSAQLKLAHASSNTAAPRSLGVHRVTTKWGATATWTAPWTSPGGDYVQKPLWTVPINGSSSALVEYTWRIDPLVEGWVSGAIPKYGVLFKPIGPLDAKFYSLDSSTNKPTLVVRYYPRC
ncbi:DNRLRE domain-containing protein [Massilia litorea]|jgi:hypothetical protein|uniref:DNRLRE domain-containing protein n=1 Tax=Massilia litorea TaxID=2769491 RepID=A0A7L9U6T4_9BURK|nr:DNRLRE domain-containing protein [Massilia litorea]QOL50783.1 DNRLRE domain-containing protein [Massilia litorea]